MFFGIVNFGFGQSKIKIAILGTFHFGETSDYANIPIPDIFSRKKQRELDQIVNDLAGFYPNKIFVENTPDTQIIWDKVYGEYRSGFEPTDLNIKKSEIFQIGIKLAKKLNDPFGVICVNYQHPEQSGGFKNSKSRLDSIYALYSGTLQAYKPNLNLFFEQNPVASGELHRFIKNNEKWSKESLKSQLLQMNEKETVNSLHYLNVTAWMDQNPNGIGAELTAKEYFRNAKIMQNILHKINPFDKHILIIIGAAHVKPLQDMIEAHPLLELVPISEILKK